jgi:hypothetical protein
MVIGIVVYFFYGAKHSNLRREEVRQAASRR